MQDMNENQRRSLIVQYKKSHSAASNYSVAKYFVELGVSQRTTYNILSNYAKMGTTDRQDGSGRKASKINKRDKARLFNEATSSDFTSQSRLASKYGVTQQYVNKMMKDEGIHTYKKQKCPCVTEKQKETQRLRIGRLYRRILDISNADPSIVMDDESYFSLRGPPIPGNINFFAYSKETASSAQKYLPVAKFQTKIMVWIAISPAGLSVPYFCQSHEAVNQEVYINKCIKKRLKPFLDEHHTDNNYLFWPDLASCHYAKKTLETFDQLNINYVTKDLNPPNCPQLRPIEDFWGIWKQLVYENGWTASNLDQLKRRIKYCMKKIDLDIVQKMMGKMKSELRKARAYGVNSRLH